MKLTDKLNKVVDSSAPVKTTTKKVAAAPKETVPAPTPPPKPTHKFQIKQISAILHTTCCGLGEAFGFQYGSQTRTKKEVLEEQYKLFERIKVGAIIGTLVNSDTYDYPQLKKDLEELGCWKEGQTFKNPNTSRKITVWSVTKDDMIEESAK